VRVQPVLDRLAFDNYIMSFANDVFPRPNFADPKAPDIEGWGVYFYGSNGRCR
jgi:hypothetical protein